MLGKSKVVKHSTKNFFCEDCVMKLLRTPRRIVLTHDLKM